jgi:hypothetical protein
MNYIEFLKQYWRDWKFGVIGYLVSFFIGMLVVKLAPLFFIIHGIFFIFLNGLFMVLAWKYTYKK